MVKQQVGISIFKGGEQVQEERETLLLGMVGILRRIGTEICLRALNMAKKSGSEEVLDLASSSVRDIKRRENIGYQEPWTVKALNFVKQLIKIK